MKPFPISWLRDPLAPWFVAVALAACSIFLAVWTLTDPVPRYQRFPAMDSVQSGDVFDIVCKAYSNRPSAVVAPPFDKSWIGFRVISDCRTVAK